MRVFIDLLLFMSVVLTAFPLHATRENIKTFKGRINVITSQDNKEVFLLTSIKTNKLYALAVPAHFVGVARLTKGKEVTIKGVLLNNTPHTKPFAGIIQVKNIAPYVK